MSQPNITTLSTTAGNAFVILTPHAGKAAPTLILLAMDGEATLRTDPYNHVGLLLHAKGWNVASLDLPCHGADRRPGEPEQLDGWAARVAKGEDIVADFRARVNDVIAHLIGAELADAQRIAAAGTSRGGYMALQAAAGNEHIAAVAAFAPVTDLVALREFAASRHQRLARQLALARSADALAARPVWMIIGNDDQRVGTQKAVDLARALVRSAAQKRIPPQVKLQVLPVPGHTSCTQWHEQAAQWLLSTFDAIHSKQ